MRIPLLRSVARSIFGMAAFLMPVALMYLPLELGSREIDRARPKLEESVTDGIAKMSNSQLTCHVCNADQGMCPLQAWRLANVVQSSITDLGLRAFGNELLLELLRKELPLGGGFREIRARAYAMDDALGALDVPRAFCRDPDPEFGARVEEAEGRLASLREYGKKEEAEALQEAIRQARAERLKEPDGREYAEAWKAEEARSQAVYEEIRGKLVEHQTALGRAWEQFDRDRPKVAVVAWTLGILEVVGWLAGLLILPGEIRALRARWAARREGRGPPR
jgi:hypothetical protein